MKSVPNDNFWKLYHSLPEAVRKEAREAFRLFRDNVSHPALHFERLRGQPDSWSVRITQNYRAVGRKHEDVMIWYWIGSHADFDRRFPA